MQKAGAELPDIIANVSQELKSVITQMLSLNSWDRPTAATLVEWSKNPSAVVEKPSRPTHRKITKLAEQPQQPKEPSPKRWIWIMLTLLLIAGLGMIGIRKYRDHQLEIAIKEQIRQDSIRQIQIQDSIREVHRQDSIRIEQERIRRQDSIAAAQAEQERLLHLQKEKEERQRKENERKRLEQSVVEKDPYNGHSYVDLGLSVKWATCNVGANTPEAYGDYFAWGETKPKVVYGEKIYKYNEGVEKTITKYNFSAAHGAVDNKYVLDLEDDAAHINWGGKWRMPTRKECAELEEICTWQWKQYNGVKGYLVTGPNGNSIFLPAAGFKKEKEILEVGIRGFYLSNTLMKAKTDYHTYSPYVLIAKWENESKYWWGRSRYYGIPVRPVCP